MKRYFNPLIAIAGVPAYSRVRGKRSPKYMGELAGKERERDRKRNRQVLPDERSREGHIEKVAGAEWYGEVSPAEGADRPGREEPCVRKHPVCQNTNLYFFF